MQFARARSLRHPRRSDGWQEVRYISVLAKSRLIDWTETSRLHITREVSRRSNYCCIFVVMLYHSPQEHLADVLGRRDAYHRDHLHGLGREADQYFYGILEGSLGVSGEGTRLEARQYGAMARGQRNHWQKRLRLICLDSSLLLRPSRRTATFSQKLLRLIRSTEVIDSTDTSQATTDLVNRSWRSTRD